MCEPKNPKSNKKLKLFLFHYQKQRVEVQLNSEVNTQDKRGVQLERGKRPYINTEVSQNQILIKKESKKKKIHEVCFIYIMIKNKYN